MNILGIDLGGSRVKLAILDAGRVKELKVFPISRGLPMGAVLDAIEAQAKRMAGIAECQGVGFAYPGLVDMENQRVLCINDKYADAAETDFSRWAWERFGLKLLLINDAAAALCGEMTYGAGRGHDSGALLMVGTGVGTAVWVQGRLLTILAEISNARKVLEIGTFTGYSATCLAYGLPEEGHIDTLEINDELEDLIREGWSRAGVEGKITLHIGDARKTIATLEGPYDLVYIDANKREYSEYYDLVFDLVRPGGLILADDVLWDGKLWQDPLPQDKQTLGIAAFNDKVMADPRVESVLLPIRDGLNVIRKK